MSGNLDAQAKLIEKISNQGVRYNNDLINEFFKKYLESISFESIADKTDEELIKSTRLNWIQAYIYGVYIFEGKKVIINRCWEINADMFKDFRDQFEGAYREATLGFGEMVGDGMRVILSARPHLKPRLVAFVENEQLMTELKDEAKILAIQNPHKGISTLEG